MTSYREDLDLQVDNGCQVPNCNCRGSLYLRAKCCDQPLVKIEFCSNAHLHIYCSECNKHLITTKPEPQVYPEIHGCCNNFPTVCYNSSIGSLSVECYNCGKIIVVIPVRSRSCPR